MSTETAVGSLLRARYRVLELVGEGGSGAVYKAEDLRLGGRLSAIKEIRPDPYATAAQLEQSHTQFRREAMTLAQLAPAGKPAFTTTSVGSTSSTPFFSAVSM